MMIILMKIDLPGRLSDATGTEVKSLRRQYHDAGPGFPSDRSL